MSTEQLILCLSVILMTTRFLGWLCHWVGQPRVVGEMIAGIVLGPSLLGALFPSAFARIFPPSSLPVVEALSQIGLLLFMFVIGLDVDPQQVFKQRMSVVLISNFSVLVPLALGLLFARAVYPRFAGEHIGFLPFALFMGTALSVTAFPVLARILKERDLLSTELGITAISCAAVDDVTAWLLLAILAATVHASEDWLRLAETLLGLAAFIFVMLIPVRKILRFMHRRRSVATSDSGFFFVLILLMLAASWVTERLGVHPLFGAFMAGVVVPKGQALAGRTAEQIESVTLALLLPLFFALTGLRTRIGLLHGNRLWTHALVVILVAVAGKFFGASLASRLSGASWKNSLALGILMNTRGLVELVILNAGLELGLLSPALFTMMVLMALVTTFMTTPLLNMVGIKSDRRQSESSRSFKEPA